MLPVMIPIFLSFHSIAVQLGLLGEGLQLLEARGDDLVPLYRVRRHHHVFLYVALESLVLCHLTLADLHDPLRMRYARRHAQKHRRVELLAHLEGVLDEILRFLAVGGLEDRHRREFAEYAVVLLVLRRMQARIVGADEYQAGADPGVGQGHERIGGDVHPDVLHRGERTGPAVTGPDRHLESHLFVDRPFGVYVVLEEPRDRLEDLRARRARVGGRELSAELVNTPGQRLIP